MVKDCQSFNLSFWSYKKKSLKLKQIKNAKMGSPWRVPLQSRKYFVVVASLKTHNSLFLNKIFTHEIQLLPTPYFYKVEIKKLWSNELNPFSISVRCNEETFIFILAFSIISNTNLLLSPIYLFLRYTILLLTHRYQNCHFAGFSENLWSFSG